MNEVPWRRILEQADGMEPLDDSSNVVKLQDHARHRQRAPQAPERPQDDWSGLEAELHRATQRDFQTPKPARPHPSAQRQQRPSPGQHAKQLQMQMERRGAVRPEIATRPAKAAKPVKTSSGARNLIAVSLSIAIVGYAAYQLTRSWPNPEGESAGNSTSDEGRLATAGLDATTEQGDKPLKFEGNRLDLRPSLASTSDWRTGDGSDGQGIVTTQEVTASIGASAQEASAKTHSTATQPDTDTDELTILNRGRGILKRGHIPGARLLFEYLAERGSALGAFQLAQTYDAHYLAENSLPKDNADQQLATKWYQRAAELGSESAAATR